jgi:hypothetical protein
MLLAQFKIHRHCCFVVNHRNNQERRENKPCSAAAGWRRSSIVYLHLPSSLSFRSPS